MKKIKLAVLPGDGIGKDVTLASIPVFDLLNLPFEITIGEIGWEFWKKEGNSVPARTWELINNSDATLLGATTSLPEKEALQALPLELQKNPPSYISPIVQLRQNLDLFANVRPCYNVKNGTNDFRFAIIRENTEGLYSGFDFYPLPQELRSILAKKERWANINEEEVSCSLRLQSKQGLGRLFEYAFKYAKEENYGLVTFADKPNVLRKSGAFAREIFEAVANKYPNIKAEIHNVDAVALWMVKKPENFGVIVAENMFGDILSDLGAGLMGGLGLAPSANIGDKGCYFEPVHGSAPRIKPNSANPAAMFLTISLLLNHFDFKSESKSIQEAVRQVIDEGEFLTYDLGGNATTIEMASAILDRISCPKKVNRISFLATGSEIINGDILDTNGSSFAKTIHQKGGNIYKHIQTSDNKNEIISALKFLLDSSDAIIVTGGLGPTSDDQTRYAISDVIKKELYLDTDAWDHVKSRLIKFNLPVTDANRQQALFPVDAVIYPNQNGTAHGAYIQSKQKHIFMLPGPPKECIPMFNDLVVPCLENLNFFTETKMYKWLTIGLIEGEIAPLLDSLLEKKRKKIAYRWHYPYLEIKIHLDNDFEEDSILHDICNILKPHLVSENEKNAFEELEDTLRYFKEPLHVFDNMLFKEMSAKLNKFNIKFINIDVKQSDTPFFYINSTPPINHNNEFSGSLNFQCNGFFEGTEIYSHTMMIPNRGPEIKEFAKEYFFWQLNLFIKTIRDKK